MAPGSAAAPDLVAPVSPQAVQYHVPAYPPPCEHGWDLSARDGLCYPNGYLPPQEQAARQQRYYRGGRYPVPCGHGSDVDSRDGRCYPTGERSRSSISRAASSITAMATTSARHGAGTTIGTERYGRRSAATASATTATSEAMVYGFGSHPSGA